MLQQIFIPSATVPGHGVAIYNSVLPQLQLPDEVSVSFQTCLPEHSIKIDTQISTTLLDDTQILALLSMVLPDLRRPTSTTLLLSSPSPGPFRPKFVSKFLEITQVFTCLLKKSISSMRGFRHYYDKVDILVLCADAVSLFTFVTNVTMMHSEVH